MPPLLQRSQAILLMSDFEGLPVALLEPMAAGMAPVLLDFVSGIPELVQQQQTGLLVPNDPAKKASPLVQLSEDTGLWQHSSQWARAYVQAECSAVHFFPRWLGSIEQHQSAARPRASIHANDLRSLLPLEPPPSAAVAGAFAASCGWFCMSVTIPKAPQP